MVTRKLEILEEYIRKFPSGKFKFYKCKCSCGRVFSAYKSKVDTGIITSCSKGECHPQVLKIIGKKFGRLTVISHLSKKDGYGYLCKCDCGKTTWGRSWALKTGRHESCGCLAREKMAVTAYKGKDVSNFHSVYKNYKDAAKRRNYSFELDKETFSNLIKEPCFYCGTIGSMSLKNRRLIIKEEEFRYNGVDRVDNSVGYIKNNCVACCNICNNSKSTLPLNEWKEWINKVYSKMNQ